MPLESDLHNLLEILPEFVTKSIKEHQFKSELIEIILDIGRRPEARFRNVTQHLSYRNIVWQDLDFVIKKLGEFSEDNRVGIEKTLHRISSIRNRKGTIIGLTCRIGRAAWGNVSHVRDLLEKKQSILLLGCPGIGKTTAIREIARVLSDDMRKRVIIIDTSNEIAGEGDLPHPSIGKARRMQVLKAKDQHNIMIEAVENHTPEVVIIDEIGTELEAAAARTIAERGVQLIGTAHGNVLENLIKNPTLTDLVGGIQYVTLGDEEAKRRGSSKSILERRAPATFNMAIEISDPWTWIVHENIEHSIDRLLQGHNLFIQKRQLIKIKNNFLNCKIINSQGIQNTGQGLIMKPSLTKKSKTIDIRSKEKTPTPPPKTKNNLRRGPLTKEVVQDFLFLYGYGVNNQDLKFIIKTLNLPVIVTNEVHHADKILALSNLIKNNKKLKQIANSRNIPIYTIQNTNLLLIVAALKNFIKDKIITLPHFLNKSSLIKKITPNLLTPSEETRLIIEEIIIPKNRIISLAPQPNAIRKLQSDLSTHYHLKSVNCLEKTSITIYPSNF